MTALARGSMSRLSTVLREIRRTDPETLLLDAGDLLQGEPPTYYYNYVDTLSTHIVSSAMNYLGYDAVAMGNHDIEPGHSVFDKWGRECKFPLIAANIISDKTGRALLQALSRLHPCWAACSRLRLHDASHPSVGTCPSLGRPTL